MLKRRYDVETTHYAVALIDTHVGRDHSETLHPDAKGVVIHWRGHHTNGKWYVDPLLIYNANRVKDLLNRSYEV